MKFFKKKKPLKLSSFYSVCAGLARVEKDMHLFMNYCLFCIYNKSLIE